MTKERKQAVCKNSSTLNRMKSQFKAKLNNNLKFIKLKFINFIFLKVSTIKYSALSPWIRIQIYAVIPGVSVVLLTICLIA